VVNDSGMIDARREERVLQLLRMLNGNLAKFKETSKRFLHISVPRVVPIFPQMRLVEDDPSSISLLDVLKLHSSKISGEYDAPIARYYERLAEIQLRGAQTTHVTLRDIFKEIQVKMIPKTVLKEWATKTFASATDYWTFRKMFTVQVALWSIVEYAFHLTRLNPDMMYMHQESGLINVSYMKFDLDDANGEMASMRPVPFRLTPNITELMTSMGLQGPFTAAIMATARCLLQPNYQVKFGYGDFMTISLIFKHFYNQVSTIMKTIMRDEYITIHRKQIMNTKPIDINDDLSQDKTYCEINSDTIIESVEKSAAVVTKRLEELMFFDPAEDSTNVAQLIEKAKNYDYLAHMDPNFYPWL
jgi:transformation/transcription domain-associated protein